MDKDTLRDMLDDVYELEALIQLAIMRDDCSKELKRLIEKKLLFFVDSVAKRDFEILNPPSSTNMDEVLKVVRANEEKENFVSEQDQRSEELEEYSIESEESSQPPVRDYEPAESTDQSLTTKKESDQNVDTVSPFPESLSEKKNEEPSHVSKEEEEENVTVFPEPPHVSAAEEIINFPELPKPDYEDNLESKEKENIESPVIPLIGEINERISTPKLRGRLVFSINDRYRFKRELFKNSDAEFNTTMAFVASMDNYEEAEEYFIDELGMDPMNPTVADFMAAMAKYFN